MRSTSLGVSLLVASLAVSVPAQAGPILNLTDFITAPDHFNGFESIPVSGNFYTGGAGPYTEDGIIVEQVNGNPGNDIWATVATFPGVPAEGSYAWYPNGGDNGYTRITFAGGAINDISVLLVPYSFGDVRYVVRNAGVTLLDGFLDLTQGQQARIGFTGGGFDEVWLRTGTAGSLFLSGQVNALLVDSIKLNAVPEPATLLLLGTGLGAVAARRRLKKRT